MLFLKKTTKFKLLYKQLVGLRENVQNQNKFLNFKSEKWKGFIRGSTRKQTKRYKYKPQDQNQYTTTKYPTRWCSYSRRYKNTKIAFKKFKLFYGQFSNVFLKKKIKKLQSRKYKKVNTFFLRFFEQRLDIVLYRSKFCSSIQKSKQLILHGNVFVNGQNVKTRSYNLKSGDLISINKECHQMIRKEFDECEVWPLPPKYLSINFKTMQVLFGSFKDINNSVMFLYKPDVEKIVSGRFTR